MIGRRLIMLAALLALVTCSTGCSFFGNFAHNMQLHRWAHWNRGEELGGGDEAYYYSISDPIPEPDESDLNVCE